LVIADGGAIVTGRVTELLTADTSGGDALSLTVRTKECPCVTPVAVQVPVAVVGGIVTGQETTVPGAPATGTLVSYSVSAPIELSDRAVPSVLVVGHVHAAVAVAALVGVGKLASARARNISLARIVFIMESPVSLE